MIITLFFLSIIGGFLSGFLGIGGAVIMVPLMLTIPELLNVGNLPVKTIAGLSMVQAFFSAISGIIVHKKNSYVDFPTLLFIGIPMSIFSFAGSFISKYMNHLLILIIFGVMVLFSFFILLYNTIINYNNISIENFSDNNYINTKKVYPSL
ncbi:MAG: sulfite exporter TauE/SafE family protein [Candidatus Marinimicrobia bacterium]|nr:sulfite exporter TauE/SafE family protein [Candidatus Neomarinimicrobiota bacterium]